MRQEGPRDLAAVYRLKGSAARSLWMTHQEPPPQNPIQFLTRSLGPWFAHYVSVMIHSRHELKTYVGGNGIFRIPDSATIALAADWGTGTIPAYKVAEQIRMLQPRPDVTVHMGDVYYSGTPEEYHDWFLGQEDWPRGTLRHSTLCNRKQATSAWKQTIGAFWASIADTTPAYSPCWKNCGVLGSGWMIRSCLGCGRLCSPTRPIDARSLS